MKNVLIINLTRMGDLVQTTPVLRGLKEKYPGAKITLLVNSVFSEICDFIPDFDRLIILELEKVLCGSNDGKLIETYSYVKNILETINSTTYDLVINFTHTPPSSILMSLINAKEKRGISIDEEGYTIKLHPWIRYFFNLLPGRNYNPFHLCDVYLMTAGVIPQEKGLHLVVSEESRQWVQSLLIRNDIKPEDLVIGFQLGASSEDKRWPAFSFARLGERLVEEFNAKIILTGSAKEAEYGREFENACRNPVLNLIGRTDLKKLVAVLERCDLLVSNDTGPLHIATAVGTKTLDISLASVYFRETGPYGDGHYVIQTDLPCSPCTFGRACTEMTCKDTISAEIVFELVSKILSGKDPGKIDNSPAWESLQVYTSFFDDDGLLNYRPLIKRPINKKELFGMVYRKTWPSILNKKRVDSGSIASDIMNKLLQWYAVSGHDIRNMVTDEMLSLESIQNYAQTALGKISLILREAEKPEPNVPWIKETWKIVPEIDNEIETIGNTCPALKPLTILFKYGKQSIQGSDLKSIALEGMNLYEDLRQHCILLLDTLTSIMESLENQESLAHEIKNKQAANGVLENPGS